jgi:membrane-associated protein
MLELPTEWLKDTPAWLVYLIPVFAFIESCIGIGLMVSGFFLLSISVLLYEQQLVNIPTIAVCAFLGALAGDLTGYLSGRMVGPNLKNIALFRPHASIISRYEYKVTKSAAITICGGRFIPAIRSIMPMLAGLSGLPLRRYLKIELVACCLWTMALCLLVSGINFVVVS